jgi:carboxypeptidase C (cathepsin A)
MTLSSNPNRFTTITNLMFIDLLGSGFSFVANSSDLPSDAKTFGSQLTEAINTFIKESVLGQIPRLFLAGEGTFIRSLSGLNDIDTLKGIIHLSAWP